MRGPELERTLRGRPVIAAARTHEDVLEATRAPVGAIFLLGASIMTLSESVRLVRDAGKLAFVHLDLCEGLGHDAAAVDWCAREAGPDGIISTREQPLKRAAQLNMITVQRLFLMDSASLKSGARRLMACPPDFVEVLPGLVPKAIARLRDQLPSSVIAGGMITDEAEVAQALRAGALGVSTSERPLWRLNEQRH